ncbi:MAG TPA: signal peptidase I [Caldisericia bacterium]|nr:signal peptidase I [Caldisericia bacterium]
MNQAWKKEMVEWLKTIIFALLIAFLVRNYLFQPYRVQMGSMQPTLHNNDLIMVNKIVYRINPPKRGDIVVFNPPGNTSNIHYIKRVIGLPGESIEVKNGKVFINQTELIEPYLSQIDTPGMVGPVVLGENEFFVLGDHRNNSMDSRDFGAITKDHIHGKTMFVLWPMKDFQVFGQVKYEIHETPKETTEETKTQESSPPEK